MKSNNKNTGKIGEDIAIQYLIDHKYTILSRNFSTKYGEIDIITTDKNTIIFVEVKTKIGTKFGIPEDMISPSKINRIKRLSHLYLSSPSYLQSPHFLGANPPLRLDTIAIILNTNHTISSLTHHQNIS